MSHAFHRRLITVVLGLYFVATWSSMAGMEIFGWLLFLLTVAWGFRPPESATTIRWRDLEPYLPWKTCLTLLLITCLGLLFNGTAGADPVYDIGSQRWMFLLATNALAIAIAFPSLRGYRFFLAFNVLIAFYAIFQSYSGMDLLRPGSNRAVQPFGPTHGRLTWRSAGLFGSPMQWGYVAGMYVCLPLSMALLLWRRKERSTLFWVSAAACIPLGLSIFTTYTRGAWIAMAFAWFTIAWLTVPKFAFVLAGSGAAALGLLGTLVPAIGARIMSLFDLNYASNSDRMILWKANWQMFKEYPIFGIGYQENEVRAGEYVAKIGYPGAFTGHAHNNYIQMLSGTGITGFVTYLILIGFMLWLNIRLIKRIPESNLWAKALALAALGAQIHLHIGGFTECNFKTGVTSHNFMIVWAIVIALTVLEAKDRLPRTESKVSA